MEWWQVVLTSSAVSSVVSVLIAGVIQVGREWWFDKRKRDDAARYLALRVAVELESFVVGCSTTLSELDNDGESDAHIPDLAPFPDDMEAWRSMEPSLAHRLLGFPSEIGASLRWLRFTWDQTMEPAEFNDALKGECIRLGQLSANLAKDLRSNYDLEDWTPRFDPREHLQDEKTSREVKAAERERRRKEREAKSRD